MHKKRVLLVLETAEEAPSALAQRVLAWFVMQRIEVHTTTLPSALHAVSKAENSRNLVFEVCGTLCRPDLVILCSGQDTPGARALMAALASHSLRLIDLSTIPQSALSEHLRSAVAPQAQSAHRPRNRFLRSSRRGNTSYDFAW